MQLLRGAGVLFIRGNGIKLLAIALLTLACTAGAANIDGKWNGEVTAAPKKGAQATGVFAFDLKTQGPQLTGSVINLRGKKPKSVDIRGGKVNGDQFTFTTVQHNKNGDATFVWQGTVSGDQITGTRTREGAKRSAKFAAKRQV